MAAARTVVVCVFNEGDPPNADYPTKPWLQR